MRFYLFRKKRHWFLKNFQFCFTTSVRKVQWMFRSRICSKCAKEQWVHQVHSATSIDHCKSLAESRYDFNAYEGYSMESLIPTSSGSATLIHFLLKKFLIFLSSRERGENLFKIRPQTCWGWIYRSGNGRSSTTVHRGAGERSQGYCTGSKHILMFDPYLTYSVLACKALWNLGKRPNFWSGSTIAAAQRG